MKQQNLLPVFKNSKRNDVFVSYDTNVKIIGCYDENTLKLFGALQNAYNYFKEYLFHNSLTSVILTLNRISKTAGYYMPNAWKTESHTNIPEININPVILLLPPIEMMSTLVHEISHHYHQFNGTPGRNGYHNREFARIMFSIGLMCSNTGMRGGKPTGQRMSHYIIDGGRFQQVFNNMPAEFILPFKAYQAIKSPAIPSGNRDKTKYRCITCDTIVWGKPNLNIICGSCKMQLLAFKPLYNH